VFRTTTSVDGSAQFVEFVVLAERPDDVSAKLPA
jgi:hypothetical protein